MKNKQYESPLFQLIRQDEPNKIFFVASSEPVSTGGTQKYSQATWNF